MAKKNTPEKKPRFYKLIAQAFTATKPHDKWLVPLVIGIPLLIIGVAVVIALNIDSIAGWIYSMLMGVMLALLAGLFTLTRRFEKTTFTRMEGQIGASLPVAQSIRRGWTFTDEPVAADGRMNNITAVVFQGVGKGGILLLAEGGASAKKLVNKYTQQLKKIVPGVPVTPIYVGTGENEVRLRKLTKQIRKQKKILSRREREVVSNRLRALGGVRASAPKGIDPLRARPDRKAVRGR